MPYILNKNRKAGQKKIDGLIEINNLYLRIKDGRFLMRRVNINKAFLIVMGFFVFIFAVFSLSKTAYSYNSEIDSINKKITELEEMKKGYAAKVIKHANTAERLQFEEGQLQIAKKHWKLSEEYNKVVEKIQTQIDELKALKLKIKNNEIKT